MTATPLDHRRARTSHRLWDGARTLAGDSRREGGAVLSVETADTVGFAPGVVPADAPSVQGLAGPPTWLARYTARLVVVDALIAAAAAGVALLVAEERFRNPSFSFYLIVSCLAPLGWVLLLAATRAYEHRFVGAGSEEYRRVFDAGVRALALVAGIAYGLRLDVARSYVVVGIPLATLLTLLLRYAARQQLHRSRLRGKNTHRVVVVGRERSAAELIQALRREPHAGFLVIGACIDRSDARTVEGVPVVGTSRTVVDALRRTGADTVAVGPWSDLTQAELRRLSWELEGSGIDVVVAPSLTDIAGPRIHVRPVAGLPLLHVEEPEFTGGRRLLKNLADRAAALLLLTVAAPFLVLIAAGIRLTSRGPALFRQTRVGIDGDEFTVFKFRSMRVTAEAELAALQAQNENADGLLFKMRADPRITRFGTFLRRYSLDELPQLINVVTGDMSLVGPRPPLPSEVERYAPDVRRRLLVRPGVTGLWQISGRSDLSWEESVRLDLHYVENWSLALDVMILWKTAFAVLKRQGAY